MKKPVKIVTAFKSLNRHMWFGEKNGMQIPPFIQRSNETYLERFERLCNLENDIYVFMDDDLIPEIEKIDKENLYIIPIDEYLNQYDHLQRRISDIQSDPVFLSIIKNPQMPEYWNSGYVLINYLKSFFVSTIANHKFNVDLIDKNFDVGDEDILAWIDFGYAREDIDAPKNGLFEFDTNNKINLFSDGRTENELKKSNVLKNIMTGDVMIQGCHIIADSCDWKTLEILMKHSIESLIQCNLIDDDQTMLLMAYNMIPNSFIINNNRGYWFNVIRNNVTHK